LIFNDLNTTEPIKVYDRGIELGVSADERRKVLVGYRTGDVWSPYVEPGEALQAMVQHFAECIREDKPPLSDGQAGLRVVRILEAATRSMRAQGGRVVLPLKGSIHGAGDAREVRTEQRYPYRAGRSAGQERGDSLLREPVRLPDR
jgi:hypothetical protein